MKPFPIFLNNLDEQRSVVVGGGHEAERKVGDLLECGANVTVISPDVTDALRHWADADTIQWVARDYRPGDLEGAFLVIVSETNPEATAPIWEEAQERNVLINAMDDVPHCTFVAGSVVRRGKLTLSISTSGAAPALSVRLRQRFEDDFGPHYETFLDWMAALREPMAVHYADFDERRRIWYAIVDSDILDLLAQGREADALERLNELAGTQVVNDAGLTPVSLEAW